MLDNKIDLDDLFKELDENNNKTLSKEEIAKWMRENGIYINQNELNKFF